LGVLVTMNSCPVSMVEIAPAKFFYNPVLLY
jgi:hypothetical protein